MPAAAVAPRRLVLEQLLDWPLPADVMAPRARHRRRPGGERVRRRRRRPPPAPWRPRRPTSRSMTSGCATLASGRWTRRTPMPGRRAWPRCCAGRPLTPSSCRRRNCSGSCGVKPRSGPRKRRVGGPISSWLPRLLRPGLRVAEAFCAAERSACSPTSALSLKLPLAAFKRLGWVQFFEADFICSASGSTILRAYRVTTSTSLRWRPPV